MNLIRWYVWRYWLLELHLVVYSLCDCSSWQCPRSKRMFVHAQVGTYHWIIDKLLKFRSQLPEHFTRHIWESEGIFRSSHLPRWVLEHLCIANRPSDLYSAWCVHSEQTLWSACMCIANRHSDLWPEQLHHKWHQGEGRRERIDLQFLYSILG